VYVHLLDDSFHAAIRTESLIGLKHAGHTADLLDLYAEGFDPAPSAARRRDYLDPVRLGFLALVRREMQQFQPSDRLDCWMGRTKGAGLRPARWRIPSQPARVADGFCEGAQPVETRLPGKCRIATRRRPSSRPIRSHTGDW
jgi:hypothetical protein